jgi:hypothetical protein
LGEELKMKSEMFKGGFRIVVWICHARRTRIANPGAEGRGWRVFAGWPQEDVQKMYRSKGLNANGSKVQMKYQLALAYLQRYFQYLYWLAYAIHMPTWCGCLLVVTSHVQEDDYHASAEIIM